MRRTLRGYVPSFLKRPAVLAEEVATLVALGSFAEADALAARALRRHGEDQSLLEQHALSAHNSGRHAVARERWDTLRLKDGSHAMAWAGVACNLRELGRIDEAASVVLEALHRFPKDAILRSEAGRIAHLLPPRRLAVADLILLAPLVSENVPAQDLPAYETYIDLVLKQSDIGEAEVVIGDLCRRSAGTPGSLFAAACLAFARAEWRQTIEHVEAFKEKGLRSPRIEAILNDAIHQMAAEAANERYRNPASSLVQFDFIVRRSPDNADWFANRVDTLIKLGRLKEAERALEESAARFSSSDSLSLVRAALLAKQEKWDEALSVLSHHLLRRPADAEALELRAHIVAERGYGSLAGKHAQAQVVPLPQEVGLEDDEITRDLLLGFESIGEDCEFGLVQRRYGAEPIGLFRWNSTRAASLTAALDAKLLGLGTPEFTLMSTWADVEYYLADKRWGFGFHTFRTQQEVGFDELYPKMCKRMSYLRNKFLADMESGDKTFVFKSDSVTYNELVCLQAALRIDAPNDLLCVKQLARAPTTDRPVAGGDVFRVSDGLYLGYVTRFGYREIKWDVLFEEWLSICRGLADARPVPFAPELL